MCDGRIFKGIENLVKDFVGDVHDAVDWTAEKIENTVKDVTGITHKENQVKKEFKEKQEQVNIEAKEKQEELTRLARQRQAVVAQQQATLKAHEAKLIEQRAAQQDLVAGLRDEQTQKISEARARGNAVTNSLRILAQKSSKAPTAQVSQKKQRTSRPATTNPGLRLGGGQSGTGSGTNYSV